MGASRSQGVVIPVGNGGSSTSVIYNNSAILQPMPITENYIVSPGIAQ